MKGKHCLPIIKNSKKEVLKSLRVQGYNYYEIWLDYIKDLDNKFIIDIAKKFSKKLIFVLRRQQLEDIKSDFKKRLEIINLLSKFNNLVDLDFLTQHEELEHFKLQNRNSRLILSYHNYKETPKIDYLENLINKMKRYNPDIYKISTFCQKESDAISLLNLILNLKIQKLNYIVLGMGAKGIVTRIVGSLWGNQFIFSPYNIKEKSAPGQLTKSEMETILSIIH